MLLVAPGHREDDRLGREAATPVVPSGLWLGLCEQIVQRRLRRVRDIALYVRPPWYPVCGNRRRVEEENAGPGVELGDDVGRDISHDLVWDSENHHVCAGKAVSLAHCLQARLLDEGTASFPGFDEAQLVLRVVPQA